MSNFEDKRELNSNIEAFNKMCRAISYANEHIGGGATIADVDVYVAEKINEQKIEAFDNEDTQIDCNVALARCDDGLIELNKEVKDGTFQEEVSFYDYAANCVEVTPDEIIIGYGGPSVRIDYSGQMVFQSGAYNEPIVGYVSKEAVEYLQDYYAEMGFENTFSEARDTAFGGSALLADEYENALHTATKREDFDAISNDISEDIESVNSELESLTGEIDSIEERIDFIERNFSDDDDYEEKWRDELDELATKAVDLEDEKNEKYLRADELSIANEAIAQCIENIYNRTDDADTRYRM